MKALISVSLDIDKQTYNVDVAIPGSAPTIENPYTFNVTQVTSDGEKEQKANLLDVKIVNEDNFLVDVEPPQSIIKLVPVVKDVSVEVSNGEFEKKDSEDPEEEGGGEEGGGEEGGETV